MNLGGCILDQFRLHLGTHSEATSWPESYPENEPEIDPILGTENDSHRPFFHFHRGNENHFHLPAFIFITEMKMKAEMGNHFHYGDESTSIF